MFSESQLRENFDVRQRLPVVQLLGQVRLRYPVHWNHSLRFMLHEWGYLSVNLHFMCLFHNVGVDTEGYLVWVALWAPQSDHVDHGIGQFGGSLHVRDRHVEGLANILRVIGEDFNHLIILFEWPVLCLLNLQCRLLVVSESLPNVALGVLVSWYPTLTALHVRNLARDCHDLLYKSNSLVFERRNKELSELFPLTFYLFSLVLSQISCVFRLYTVVAGRRLTFNFLYQLALIELFYLLLGKHLYITHATHLETTLFNFLFYNLSIIWDYNRSDTPVFWTCVLTHKLL